MGQVYGMRTMGKELSLGLGADQHGSELSESVAYLFLEELRGLKEAFLLQAQRVLYRLGYLQYLRRQQSVCS
jgi:hypothetical protein